MDYTQIDFCLTVDSLTPKPEKLIHILEWVKFEEFTRSTESNFVKLKAGNTGFFVTEIWQVLHLLLDCLMGH